MQAGDVFRLIFCFIAFCAILWGAYAASKWFAARSGMSFSSKFMRIVDRIPMTRDSSLCIIQIGERYFLAGISSGNINLLSELYEEDLTLLQPQEMLNPIDGIYRLFDEAKNNGFKQFWKRKDDDKDNDGGFYNIFKKETEENSVDRIINESRRKTDRLKKRKSDEDESDEE